MNSWRQRAAILPAMMDTVRSGKLSWAVGPGRQEQSPGKESDSGVTLWEGSSTVPAPTSPGANWSPGPGLAWSGGLHPLDRQRRLWLRSPWRCPKALNTGAKSASENPHFARPTDPAPGPAPAQPSFVCIPAQSLGRKAQSKG